MIKKYFSSSKDESTDTVCDYEVTTEANQDKLQFGIDRSKQGSSFTAFFNVVCVVAGTGALGLPYALSQGGWIGLFILGLSWILSVYTGIILIKSMYYDGTHRLSSYQEVAEAAFGPIGGWLAFFFTAITLVGVPVLYLLLSGLNLHNVAKGTSAYAHVEAGMRRPKDWNKVCFTGLTFCVILYFLTAVPGYYVYGTSVKSPVYDSLPDGGPKSASIIIITIHLILATPILLTSFAIDVEKMLKISPDHRSFVVEWALRWLFRGALIVAIAVIAIFVPFFGDFMSLLGAFSNCALAFIFPVIFYYKLTGIRGKPWYDYILGFLTLLLGIVGLIFGTISAIKALNNDFKSQHS
ncbi:hypothetical protein RMCBS344292_14920 [Rhizopus microsporus]|nr:hypothetical protein RMCBS344292_14920 [Rhizopus microsporus]